MLADGSRHEVEIMKLLEVIITEDKQHHFIFEGEMEKDADEAIGYSFDNLQIYEMVDGKKVPYEVSGHTWAGADIDEEYALAGVISRYTRDASSATLLYVEPELNEALKPYVEDTCLSAVHRISPKVLYGSLMEEYTLTFVTDKYAYYVSGDRFLMLEMETGEVLADNYFAEVGYTDSEDAVTEGKEIMLYKEYEFHVGAYIVYTLNYVHDNSLSEFSYKCMCGSWGEHETIHINGTVKDSLATFRIEREKTDGHICSAIPVFDMPLTDKAIEQLTELAREGL